MAYANASTGKCPADHPVSLPQLTYEVDYPYLNGGSNYVLSSGGIYSWHGDFIEGWDTRLEQGLIDNCLNVKQNSCHTTQVWPNGNVTINNGVFLFSLDDYPPTPTTTTTTTPTTTTTTTTTPPVAAPTVTFDASRQSIKVGRSTTLTWSSTDATSCTATEPDGFSISDTSGTVTVAPTETTTYSISCSNSSGDASASVTIAVHGKPT
jgi:hypothetical protein